MAGSGCAILSHFDLGEVGKPAEFLEVGQLDARAGNLWMHLDLDRCRGVTYVVMSLVDPARNVDVAHGGEDPETRGPVGRLS